jgi:integrase
MMLAGVRPGEARALKCSDVNLSHQSVTIHSTFSKEIYRAKRKGRKAKPIVIPIHSECLPYITDRIGSSLPAAWLFPNPRHGDHYRLTTIRKIWDRLRVKMGIKGLRLYDATRHSFASQLINKETSIYRVSRLLGHSTTKMTERYAHQDLQGLRMDLEKLSLKKVVLWQNYGEGKNEEKLEIKSSG